MRSLLITFDRHPRSVFAPAAVPLLLTPAKEKMELLKATGVDDIYVLPFDAKMAALTAKEFMQRVLKEQLGVEVLVIGYDHRFGRPLSDSPRGGEGFHEYQEYGREVGIEVVLAKELEGEHVSSSEIRRALAAGDVQRAAQLLGRPYTWTGRVVHGHEVGRQLGFPTANLEAVENGQLTVGKMLPANGAYAVVGGMLNIGTRPTIGNGSDVSVEVNLFDIRDNLYGQTLTLSFIARLREERRFESEEDLISQLQHDKQLALSLQP